MLAKGDRERPLVVVADDDTEIACLVELVLRREGLDVMTAMDGAEALELIEQKDPDAAVLDIMMPSLDGYEITRRLRAEEATRSLPVVLVSARAGALDRKFGMQVGANEYVLKPFSPQDLATRVLAVLPKEVPADVTAAHA